MGIKRTVSTEIHCDICGEYIDDWCSTRTGVSIEWAKYYARLKGCTAGKKVICKECRIKQRIEKCRLQKKWENHQNLLIMRSPVLKQKFGRRILK